MAKSDNPFRYFDSSPEVIRLVVMMYVKYPLSLRNVEDLLAERGIDICHETVRLWWNRFGPMFAAEIRRKRVDRMRQFTHWRWHLDEVYVKINGEMRYLWRAVDHEGEVLESFVTKERDKAAALKFIGPCELSSVPPAPPASTGDMLVGLTAPPSPPQAVGIRIRLTAPIGRQRASNRVAFGTVSHVLDPESPTAFAQRRLSCRQWPGGRRLTQDRLLKKSANSPLDRPRSEARAPKTIQFG